MTRTDPYPETFEAAKSSLLDRFLTATLLLVVPIILIVSYFGFRDGWGIIPFTQIAALCMTAVLSLRKHLGSSLHRAIGVIFLLSFAATAEVFRVGLDSPTFGYLVVLSVIGSAIGGVRWGIAILGACVLILIAAALFTIAGDPAPQGGPSDLNFSVIPWADQIFNVAAASGMGIFVVGLLYNFFLSGIEKLNERNHELIRSELRNTESTRLANLGHALMDMETGHFVECDAAYAEMHGQTVAFFHGLSTSAKLIETLIHEEDRDAAFDLRRRVMQGESLVCELRYCLPNGDTRYLRKIFSQAASPGQTAKYCQIISQEVSETRLAQEKLFQAQKMDAIGKLTGGVAHDFNNLLAVILGNLELLNDELTDADHKELIQNGIDATLRGAELTRNMLSFARKAPLAPTVVDINQLIRNLNVWIGRTLSAKIELETSLLGGLWPTEVDASSAESAFLNLILNARDAMPDGGKLTVETANVRVDDEYVQLRGEDIEPGRYVMLAVTDTGEGISSANLRRIFEPFFTTKPVGSGSGLGLAMLEGFMRQSGGTVRVYSEVGVGTTFKLYFPAAKGDALNTHVAQTEPQMINRHAHATILLVEDNADVLATIKTALLNAGYHVICAMSGDEGLATFERVPDIDLLLTDIVMPGELQGTTLAQVVRAIQPDLPVVFMSGYAREATVHGNGLRADDIRLMKPVRRADLLRAIDKALDLRDS